MNSEAKKFPVPEKTGDYDVVYAPNGKYEVRHINLRTGVVWKRPECVWPQRPEGNQYLSLALNLSYAEASSFARKCEMAWKWTGPNFNALPSFP